MSDLSLQLQQASSQLPVSAYFDEALYAREMRSLFAAGPRYVGHRLAVPEPGDFFALPQEQEGRALVHTPKGVELISNVCRHRQAIILRGRGQLDPAGGGNIVCPLHRWTYSTAGPQATGTLVGAPHFEQDPCMPLRNYPLTEWNGLLFEPGADPAGHDVATDLARIDTRADLDFEGYVFDRVELHECNYNWKTFIEVYLEDYHVAPFHPGLGNFVTCDDLRWEFGKHHSVQAVGIVGGLGRAGSPVYRRWQEQLLKYRAGEPPKHGAIWLAYYPNVMVEWYPHVLVVSTLHPMGPRKTLNQVEFFYPEDIAAFEREFVEAEQAAYMETCIEDDEIAERMDAGRQALMLRGDDERGPYQSPMEDGMQHFHEWYRDRMGI
jgi:phenylpropionate dioxygenase-like ring-hydroxylating dioxygenase large terminal subunit